MKLICSQSEIAVLFVAVHRVLQCGTGNHADTVDGPQPVKLVLMFSTIHDVDYSALAIIY